MLDSWRSGPCNHQSASHSPSLSRVFKRLARGINCIRATAPHSATPRWRVTCSGCWTTSLLDGSWQRPPSLLQQSVLMHVTLPTSRASIGELAHAQVFLPSSYRLRVNMLLHINYVLLNAWPRVQRPTRPPWVLWSRRHGRPPLPGRYGLPLAALFIEMR